LKSIRVLLLVLTSLVSALAQDSPLTLHADTLFDGKGNVQRNVTITVQNGKIVSVDQQSASGTTYDLRGLTVMPGWIDTHVHITWHFGPNGRFEDKSETPAEATLAASGNAWKTLAAGFTTVQSLGSPEDKALRDSINRGVLPGPRIITALRPLTDTKLTPEQIRDHVRKLKADGADVLKIFVSKSIREGGGQTLTDEQLKAACDEAKAQGLRSVVHAYRSAVKVTALAGCTTVEHGTYATDDDLRAMANYNTFFDPQVGLVIHNYLDNKSKFLGIGNYTEEGFAKMQEVLPLNAEMFKRALKTPGLKIVFGTDAVAGAHGRNAEEFIYRVRDGGQDPMAALVAANATAAESLGMASQIGTIAPGMQADIIALDGDPRTDITVVRRVVFVMKDGKVYKNEVPSRH
jgi:imidazolonepropionase-like amidohydrolase